MSNFDDINFPMQFGVHKGKKLGDVPVSYIKWMIENDVATGMLKETIDEWEEEILTFDFREDDFHEPTLFKELVESLE